MGVVVKAGGLCEFEASEGRVADELVGWKHAEGSHWHYLAIVVHLVYYYAQAVQLCEVLGLHHKLFPVEAKRLSWLAVSLNEDLFMLTGEELGHAAYSGHELASLGW